MFRKLIQMLKQGDLMDQALQDSYKMFEESYDIFEKASRVFLKGEDVQEDIYAKDRRINRMEKEIRRKILEHLSISPRQDVVGALVLTTVIVHMERIGDFSKNIYELAVKRTHSFSCKYYPEAEKLTSEILTNFEKAIVVFREGREQEARQLMEVFDRIKKECERNIDKIMEETDISVKDAIIYTLYFRYLKRISAHILDISSSVCNPFEMIDFFKEPV